LLVSVQTTNSQAPNGIQSTATYRLTIDGAHGWVITEIGASILLCRVRRADDSRRS